MKKITPALPVLARIKKQYSLSTDKELRELLDIKRSTLDGWKKNDAIPEPALFKFARKEKLSTTWITTGEGPAKDFVETLPEPLFFTPEISEQLSKYVSEAIPSHLEDKRTARLCAAFDVLEDEQKDAVLKELLPLIIKHY